MGMTLEEQRQRIEEMGPMILSMDSPHIAELHPALRASLIEIHPGQPALKHPWVNMVLGVQVGHANKLLRSKWGMTRGYLSERNFSGYLFVVVERPWRMSTLERFWSRGKLSIYDLRELLPEVWADYEMPLQNLSDPTWLFHEAGFISDDPEAWAELPETIEVWRGGPQGGCSWTLDRAKAEWFAQRFRGTQEPWPLWRGQISKANALAHMTARGENEIIIEPEDIEWTKV